MNRFTAPLLSALAASLVLSPASYGGQTRAACQATIPIDARTNLAQVSDVWFGDSSFRFAILLASNARAGQDGIAYISNIDALPVGSQLCVPGADEANRLRRRYDRYVDAVHDAAMAEPFEVVDTLDPLPQTGAFTVVSWVRSDQLADYPDGPGQFVVPGDTWVTLDPHLQEFCATYRTDVTENPDALVLRLEQRLGLPPSSSKTHFVRFELAPDLGGDDIFRPCGAPATDTTSCRVGIPDPCGVQCQAHRDFFYGQYYSAFGTAEPVQYPWTSLGYTFDWAPGEQRLDGTIGFQRVGESEYVVPAGTPVRYVGAQTTAQFCSGSSNPGD